MQKSIANRGARLLALSALGVTSVLLLAVPAGAESGQVEVKAQNSAKLTLSLSTATSNFGSGLDPSGAPAKDPDGLPMADVAAYQDGGNGAYYVKKGTADPAQTVKVSSNTAWTGSVRANESVGTAGMKIADNSLRWKRGNMANQADAQGGTAFSTLADPTAFGQGAQPKGINSYDFDYSLRVLWTDDPGTFSSIVTYNAQQ